MRRAAAALFLVLLAPWPAPADETVRIGDLPAISNAGIYVAIEQGFFKEKGIVVGSERFASGAKMIGPLASGQLDVAVGTPSAALYNSIASGMDFRIVADKGQQRLGYSFVPLVVRKDLWESGRVRSVKDLKGLKVASGAKGINLDYFLARTLEHAGLAFDSIDVTYLAYPDVLRALAAKAVDAAIAPEPWGVRAEEQKVGVRAFLTEQVPAIATFQVAVVMYSGRFIKERPQVARDFLQAYVRGVKWYGERGLRDAEVAAILAKHTQVPPETIKATIPFYIDPAARPRAQDIATFQDWFHQMGWVKEKAAMERIVDLSFLE